MVFAFAVMPTAASWAQATASDHGLPSNVIVMSDISYGPDPMHKLDIYRNPGRQAGPVIVMIHGGGWAKGDKASHKVVDNKAKYFLKQGYVFVSVNYRLHPVANPLDQANDVAAALTFIQEKASRHDIDPENIVLIGHSSGAHLVALVSADPSIVSKAGGKPWKASILLDSAGLNIPERMQQGRTELFETVFGNDPDFLKESSPYHRLTNTAVPMMIVCSSLRRTSCPQAHNFARQAQSVSGGHFPVWEEPLSHEMINVNLGLNGNYTKAVDDFIRSVTIN